ncbi:MAG: hypothetical protein ACWA5K_03725, partial [bacterium]
MRTIRLSLVVLLIAAISGCASMGEGSIQDKRQQIHNMREDALTKLFKEKPDTRSQINSAAGYAVFSNASVNVVFVAGGTGYGIVKNNRTGAQTYMNMAEGGVGLGIGVK